MPQHVNTFENVKEAMMRLRRTVVVYDGAPYVVLVVTNHKADGIFRIYLDPIGRNPDEAYKRPEIDNFPPEHPGIGPYVDGWMIENPNSGIIRKQMNSPLFNKFRPYPLGMVNIKGSGVYYVERQPNRKTEQGLISSMLNETPISTSPSTAPRRSGSIDVYGEAFKNCVMGKYPTAAECLTNLLDPDVTNDAAAFDRNFALVRGPIEMLFVAYKHDVVGVLTKNNLDCIRLGREFHHTKEVVEKLGVFQSILM